MSQQTLARQLRAQAYRLRKELHPSFTPVKEQPNLTEDEYNKRLAEENKDMDYFVGQHIAQLLEMTPPSKSSDDEESYRMTTGSPTRVRNLTQDIQDQLGSQLEAERTSIRQRIQEMRRLSTTYVTTEHQNPTNAADMHPASPSAASGDPCQKPYAQLRDSELISSIEGMKDIEKNMTLFQTASLEDWLDFKQRYHTYKIRNGKKNIVELFDSNPLAIYARVFKIPVKTLITLNDDVIINGIDDWHGVHLLKNDYKTLFQSIIMPNMDITAYKRSTCEKYFHSFLSILNENPLIEQKVSGPELCNYFIKGLQPQCLRNALINKQCRDFDDLAFNLFNDELNQLDAAYPYIINELRKNSSSQKPKSTFISNLKTCRCCGEAGCHGINDYKKCPQYSKCPRCKNKVGIPAHEYWNKDYCVYRKDYYSKQRTVKNFQAKTAITEETTEEVGISSTTLPHQSSDDNIHNIPSSSILDVIKSFNNHVTIDPNIIIDSGANSTIVNDTTLQNYNLSLAPLTHRHDLITCSGDKVVIEDTVEFLGNTCLHAPHLVNTLISTSQVVSNDDSIMVFDKSGLINIKNDISIHPHLSSLIEVGYKNNLVSLTGQLSADGMYHPHNESMLPSKLSDVPLSISNSSANRTSFFHTELTTHSEMVRFFPRSMESCK
jgi:hypothetical protein